MISEADKKERFVGKVCELQLMYQAGWFGLQTSLAKGALGGPPVILQDYEAKHTVDTYRRDHGKIKAMWKNLDTLLAHMCEEGTQIEFRGLVFEHQRVLLPSGMYLNYPGLKSSVNRETGCTTMESSGRISTEESSWKTSFRPFRGS
jgi:hypothetical protein